MRPHESTLGTRFSRTHPDIGEWVNDRFGVSYGGYGDGLPSRDPNGPTSGFDRVFRGGDWYNVAEQATVAARDYGDRHGRGDFLGLRLVRTIPIPSTPTVAISPTSPTDSDDLACTASGSEDIDGDSVSYVYSWTVNGVASTITADTVPAASTATGDVWTCSATATDGTDSSAAVTASVTVAADAAFADYTTEWGSEMVAITAGSFNMGCCAGDPDSAYTDHEVTLTHDFWMGRTEITKDEWESDTADNSGWSYSTYSCGAGDCPADQISWFDFAIYANALSAAEGFTPCYTASGGDLAAAYVADPYSCPGYRMPTEAEWEYAAGAGVDADEYAGSNTADDVAWTDSNSGSVEHPTAGLAANAWGLYDMSGNLFEWTDDWYDADYAGYGSGAGESDPPGPTAAQAVPDGSARVFRGGFWGDAPSYAAVAYRTGNSPSNRGSSVTARLARTVP